jgi:hypothetical protein
VKFHVIKLVGYFIVSFSRLFYLLGVVVVIGVIGLGAEYSAVAHGQFLRTTL